ncbi:ATP-grasp domain-containing protein [Haloferula sp. A504]|uniref:ATP-grasp domain-containing protein n=1 Tax=Haloferula sp. A504 TaxID=3373601 RepID=UPI0031C68BEE|nr:ATP-grasp domain-containing protein [Verrucomicrobiaceae bacterium E54]
MPIALVLGGTAPHAELCLRLKDRGYHVVLIDYLEAPPAKFFADEHLVESTLHPDKVLAIARERRAELVIATCVDQANVTAVGVLEKLGKHVPYSHETARLVSDKVRMKARMAEGGIPSSRFVTVSDALSEEWRHLRFPLIVKPSDSNGSKGVRRCDTPAEVRCHLKLALTHSRSGSAVVEEFVTGREIAFDSYVSDKGVRILMTRERRKIGEAGGPIQQIFGSFWPASVSSDIEAKLTEVGDRIAETFGLRNTPLMVQTIVNGEDVSVIEFAPRIGGGENHHIIEVATGCDVLGAAIDSYLGEVPVIKPRKPEKIFLDSYLYARPCVLGGVQGLEQLGQEGRVDWLKIYKAPGTRVGEEISSNNRIASFTISADSEEEGLLKIDEILTDIEIRDSDGNPVMLREIY